MFLFPSATSRFSRFHRRRPLLLVIVFDETSTPFSGHQQHWSRFWENNYDSDSKDGQHGCAERVVTSAEDWREDWRKGCAEFRRLTKRMCRVPKTDEKGVPSFQDWRKCCADWIKEGCCCWKQLSPSVVDLGTNLFPCDLNQSLTLRIGCVWRSWDGDWN